MQNKGWSAWEWMMQLILSVYKAFIHQHGWLMQNFARHLPSVLWAFNVFQKYNMGWLTFKNTSEGSPSLCSFQIQGVILVYWLIIIDLHTILVLLKILVLCSPMARVVKVLWAATKRRWSKKKEKTPPSNIGNYTGVKYFLLLLSSCKMLPQAQSHFMYTN